MIKQKLIPILVVLMLSFVLVFASCNPTTDDGDGGAGDGGNNDGGAGDGGNNDGGAGDGGSTTTYKITTSVNDEDMGEIILNPAKDSYEEGSTVTATASPKTGYGFKTWSGDVPAGDEEKVTITLTMDDNKTLAAEFAVAYTLSVTVSDDNVGEVKLDPAKDSYADGSIVTATAKAKVDSHRFKAWSGDAVTTGGEQTNPLVLTMDSNKTLHAEFEAKPTYTMAATPNDANLGEVTIDPVKDTYYEGDKITVTATPKSMKNFDGWTGAAAADKFKNPLQFVITENTALTAVFSSPKELALNEWKDDDYIGPARWFYFDATENNTYVVYTVDKGIGFPDKPKDGLVFDNKVGLYKKDGSPYTYYFPSEEDANTGQIDVFSSKDKIICVAEEDEIYVKVTPFDVYDFTPGTYYLRYNDCKKLTVSLEKGENVPADVTLSDIGSIEPGVGTHWVEKNSDATVTVTAKEGYYLSAWTDDVPSGSTDTSITITMNDNKTVGAVISKLDNQVVLTTEVVGGGSIDEDPKPGIGGVYPKDTPVTLTQTPTDGTWEFVKWTIMVPGEGTTESTDDTLSVTMDKSKTVTAYFRLRDQELTLGEWKGGDLTNIEDQWFYFTAEAGKVYEVYTHDSEFYHPDNPSGNESATLDNKVGVYKDNSESPASYTYTNVTGSENSGQLDIYPVGDYGILTPCLEITADGTKVWVKVTGYFVTSEGTYWVKVIEKDTTPTSLTLTVEDKTDADSFEVSVNYGVLTPDSSVPTQLVYEGINTGRSVLITITPGPGRKVEVTGTDADKVVKRPDSSDIGILMDADKAITITFSAE